jgi:hypothetical protein
MKHVATLVRGLCLDCTPDGVARCPRRRPACGWQEKRSARETRHALVTTRRTVRPNRRSAPGAHRTTHRTTACRRDLAFRSVHMRSWCSTHRSMLLWCEGAWRDGRTRQRWATRGESELLVGHVPRLLVPVGSTVRSWDSASRRPVRGSDPPGCVSGGSWELLVDLACDVSLEHGVVHELARLYIATCVGVGCILSRLVATEIAEVSAELG